MNLSALKAALEQRLPGSAVRIEPSRHLAGKEVIVIPAAHADVGDVLIEDAGDELTLYIGRITHVHFGGLDGGRSAEEQANARRCRRRAWRYGTRIITSFDGRLAPTSFSARTRR